MTNGPVGNSVIKLQKPSSLNGEILSLDQTTKISMAMQACCQILVMYLQGF